MSTDTKILMAGESIELRGTGSALENRELQEFLKHAADMGHDRVKRMDLFEEYYDGEHRTELTDRARTYLEPTSEIDFSENFCEVMVDEPASRMQVERIIASGGGLTEERLLQIGQVVTDWWNNNRLPRIASVVHTRALMLSEAFLLLDWDEEGKHPVFAYNDPRRVRAHYPGDDTESPEYVAKRWSDSERGPLNPEGKEIERLNLYYPDHIEKYYTFGKGATDGWEYWLDEDGVWPTPWVDDADNPLGIPVVHFRNKPLGGVTGTSELQADIPFQDAHNKLVIDLMMILDNQSWTQRYVIGQGEDDAELKNVPGEVWSIPDEKAKVGQFEAESPEGVLKAIENGLNRRARRARIPMHLLTGGDMPSGEALRAAEAPLVKKVSNRMETFGDAWEDAMRIALRMARADLGEEVPEDVVLSVEWNDPGTPDPKGDLEAAVMKQQLGVSKATLMEEMGYDPDKEAERREDERQTSLVGAMRAFDTDADGGSEGESV